MKVLFAASEVWPFIKTGGLADVAYSLPKCLKSSQIDIRVILPKHSLIKNEYLLKAKKIGSKEIWVSHHNEYLGIEKITYENIIFYLVDNERYFKRDTIYGQWDDCERYTFFCKAVTECLDIINFKPDIIHCNDWQTALIPIYIKERKLDIKSIFTIHNLRFQGFFYNDVIEKVLEISRNKYYYEDGIKYHDMISLLKGGVVYSDIVTTVSPTYSKEIKTSEYGEGIEGIFKKYEYKVYGILNGIDKSTFKLPIKSKTVLKREFQEKMKLEIRDDIPLICFIGRLDRQKGIDLIIEKFDKILDLGVQFVLLGSGEKKYEEFFKRKEFEYKGRVISYIGFNSDLSEEIYAASDILLMPSLYEPCGLSQMIAMKYGCIPLVRETGGLKDTVFAYNEYSEIGNGFSFANISSDEMYDIIKYAINIFINKRKWNKLIISAKKTDNSWETSAKEYKKLYKKLTDN